jgi:photosystem II stability/assembly factor-like uncharacterized protein
MRSLFRFALVLAVSLVALSISGQRPAQAVPTAWTSIGPTNIEGRVTAIALHPTNPNVILAGGETGGIFRSTNAGTSWELDANGKSTADRLPNLAVADIQFVPNDPEPTVAFAGAGGGNLYKSTDSGATWPTIITLPDGGQVDRIRIDPTNTQIMYAVQQGPWGGLGVYKSTNGGGAWTKVLTSATYGAAGRNDLAMTLGAPFILYATLNGVGVFRTFDGGATWTQLNTAGSGLPTNFVEGSIGVAPSSPNVVYLTAKSGDPGDPTPSRFYRSEDLGTSWTLRTTNFDSNPVHCCFGETVVDPTNPSLVYFSHFFRLFKSTDGGATLVPIPQNHVDEQSFAIQPGDSQKLWAGNDGGLEKSTNQGASWTEVNGVPVTQFYDLAVAPNNPNLAFGATQDNGVNRYRGTLDWDFIDRCGDATGVVIDPINPSTVYARCWNGFDESLDGGNNWQWASSGLDQSDLQWKAQTGVFPLAANTLYAGGQRVYKSHREPSGLVWTPISGNLQPPYRLTAVASSWTNENRVYASFGWPGSGYGGYLFRTDNGGANWTPLTSPVPGEFISSIAVDPVDDRVAYFTTGEVSASWVPQLHLWRTQDAGANWTSIGASLPPAAYNDIAISPSNRNRIVVVNGIGGVFESLNGGTAWSAAGDLGTLPNTIISGVSLECGVDLTVSTYGRGMWRLPGSNPPVDTDGDGFSDCAEQYMGTNINLACPLTSAADDEAVDAWPPDFNDDTFVDISDTARLNAQRFGAKRGDPDYNPRYDLNADGFIDISDVSVLNSRWGQTCR